MMPARAWVSLALVLSACASTVRFSSSDGNTLGERSFRGIASYYGEEFRGRLTASGEPYDPTQFTAAHPSLPFGTRLRVRNLHNGRTVIVRINDRGPRVSGRVLDLSLAAAHALEMLSQGIAEVECEILP